MGASTAMKAWDALAAVAALLWLSPLRGADGFATHATHPAFAPTDATHRAFGRVDGPPAPPPLSPFASRARRLGVAAELQSQSKLAAGAGAGEDAAIEHLDPTEEEIDAAVDCLAVLLQRRLDGASSDVATDEKAAEGDNVAYELAKGRFHDLTATLDGERLLEGLFFLQQPAMETGASATENNTDDDGMEPSTATATNATAATMATTDVRRIKIAIAALQSLLVCGMQIGVKGTSEMQHRLVRHLFRPGDPPMDDIGAWADQWDADCIRRLKFHRDVRLGQLVLANMVRKRTAAGAFGLLVALGAWTRHEDAALLRSGFPVRFLEWEARAADAAQRSERDVDALLGLRADLRHQKVYTIDGAATLDVDDGLSVEALEDGDGGEEVPRHRYWIHIADVDRWAPRGSELLAAAERRGTSLYLPTATLGMFPESMSAGAMSLAPWEDKCALSLGVELHPDGSIDAASIVINPSRIRVDYRLTYDQVDEMLDEGVGYTEEWPIGAMLAAAAKRRAHRVERGSTEGMVPCPIPKGMVTAAYDDAAGEYDVSLKIETTHNSGANATAGMAEGVGDEAHDPYCSPVSSSQLIVTEMMILAGEAIGKWHQLQEIQEGTNLDGCVQIPNALDLPYRRQPAPDFKSRETEARQLEVLLATNRRYPHAWYARRFFNKVAVSEQPGPHFGMGLDCYVQWTSPIRRLTDLQVHASVKRYLRRKRVNSMLRKGMPLPPELTSVDLGYDISNIQQPTEKSLAIVDPIDYSSGLGQIFAGRPIQFSSSNYWLFEYIRRKIDRSGEEAMFESVVLGCVNQERFQYAVYVFELGLEHRYLSETGKLEEGKRLWLKVGSVNPRMELLTFSLASKSGGLHAQQKLPAPAA